MKKAENNSHVSCCFLVLVFLHGVGPVFTLHTMQKPENPKTTFISPWKSKINTVFLLTNRHWLSVLASACILNLPAWASLSEEVKVTDGNNLRAQDVDAFKNWGIPKSQSEKPLILISNRSPLETKSYTFTAPPPSSLGTTLCYPQVQRCDTIKLLS